MLVTIKLHEILHIQDSCLKHFVIVLDLKYTWRKIRGSETRERTLPDLKEKSVWAQNNYIQKGISRRIVSHASLRMLNFLASVMREFY